MNKPVTIHTYDDDDKNVLIHCGLWIIIFLASVYALFFVVFYWGDYDPLTAARIIESLCIIGFSVLFCRWVDRGMLKRGDLILTLILTYIIVLGLASIFCTWSDVIRGCEHWLMLRTPAWLGTYRECVSLSKGSITAIGTLVGDTWFFFETLIRFPGIIVWVAVTLLVKAIHKNEL